MSRCAHIHARAERTFSARVVCESVVMSAAFVSRCVCVSAYVRRCASKWGGKEVEDVCERV